MKVNAPGAATRFDEEKWCLMRMPRTAGRIFLATFGLLAAAAVTGCGNNAYSAELGDCLDKAGFVDLSTIKIVPCDSAEAKYRVSAVLPEGQKDNCPSSEGAFFTHYWENDGKTFCVLEK